MNIDFFYLSIRFVYLVSYLIIKLKIGVNWVFIMC